MIIFQTAQVLSRRQTDRQTHPQTDTTENMPPRYAKKILGLGRRPYIGL